MRLHILCFSVLLLTIPLLKGMDLELLQKMSFDMLVNVIESKHASARQIERQDAMVAMTLITSGNANSNPSFVSNHQEKVSYKRFAKLSLTNFFVEMEKTIKIAENIDQKNDDIDMFERMQKDLAAHNKTIVFTPQQLRSNPHLLAQPCSANPATLSMSFKKCHAEYSANQVRWMEGTEEMIPLKEKALGKICLLANTQRYYNELFEQYINEINQYNSGNKETPQAALLSIAENIEIFKYLPAYENSNNLIFQKR